MKNIDAKKASKKEMKAKKPQDPCSSGLQKRQSMQLVQNNITEYSKGLRDNNSI